MGRWRWLAGMVVAAGVVRAADDVVLGVRPAGQVSAVEGQPVALPLALPGESQATLHTAVSNWVGLSSVRLALRLPADAPSSLQVLVHVIDWDGFWYQSLAPGTLAPGVTNRVVIDVAPQASGWEPLGHHGAWNRRSLMQPREVGLRVFGKMAYTGQCEVVSALGVALSETTGPTIRHVRANDAAPPVLQALHQPQLGRGRELRCLPRQRHARR